MTKAKDQLNELKTESILKKYLTAEVKWLIAVIGFIVGVVTPYYKITTDIAIIKQNHYTHIEAMQKNIDNNTQEIKALVEKEYVLMQKLAEVDGRVKSLEK
jgi:uncharacterized membrane-anchored protein YhcB (DUF1043 family)